MKIFLAFFQSKVKYSIPAYSFWEYYIKNGIIESGNEWCEVNDADWAYGYAVKDKEKNAHWKDVTWGKTISYLKENKVDIFLSYLYPEQIEVDSISFISKELGIPTVNFFCDNLRDFTILPKEFKPFTCHWVPEIDATKMYTDSQLEYFHAPMPMWVPHHYRSSYITENNQISFIGSYDVIRNEYLSKLKNSSNEINQILKIYGSGWQIDEGIEIENLNFDKILNQLRYIRNFGTFNFFNKIKYRLLEQKSIRVGGDGFIDNQNYFDISRSSLVSIGINSVVDYNRGISNPLKYSRLRDIEVPMIGGCYLTEMTNDILSYYDVGKDILTYNNADELISNVKLLIKNADLRKQLRINAQIKALNELDITTSLVKLNKKLF